MESITGGGISPAGTDSPLRALGEAGAHEQATALATRAATQFVLDEPGNVARLLDALREAGAKEQIEMLVGRLPAEGQFRLFLDQADHQALYRLGREPDGSPAATWNWENLD
jgi:hypothetical protein